MFISLFIFCSKCLKHSIDSNLCICIILYLLLCKYLSFFSSNIVLFRAGKVENSLLLTTEKSTLLKFF